MSNRRPITKEKRLANQQREMRRRQESIAARAGRLPWGGEPDQAQRIEDVQKIRLTLREEDIYGSKGAAF